MATPPNLESLSPLAQVTVITVSTVVGALIYLFGPRLGSKNEGNQYSNIVSAENDKLRADLTVVLESHNSAVNNRIQQQSDALVMWQAGATAEAKLVAANLRDFQLEITDRLARIEVHLEIKAHNR